MFFRQKAHEVRYTLRKPAVCPNVEVPYFANAKGFGFDVAVPRNDLLRHSETKGAGRSSSHLPGSPRSTSNEGRERGKSFGFDKLGVTNFGEVLIKRELLRCPVIEMAHQLAKAEQKK